MGISLMSCGGASTPQTHAETPPPPSNIFGGPIDAHAQQALATAFHEGRELTPAERTKVQPLLDAAERIRGLHFVTPVPLRIQTPAQIRAFIATQIDDEDLLKSKNLYAALGMIPADFNLREELLSVMEEQVAGYYDPKAKRMVIRDDVMNGQSATSQSMANHGFDEQATVLVHELIHALQDQHFGGLEAEMEAHHDTDESDAIHSLVEGDATLGMLGYTLESRGISLPLITSRVPQLRVAMAGMSLGPDSDKLQRAPRIERVSMVAPYLEGMLFCATLFHGSQWQAVDGAHAHPPVSMEQVLHPQKFLEHELPHAATHSMPNLSQLGYVQIAMDKEDTLGELEMGVYFAQGLPSDTAGQSAAAGWNGDRIGLYRNPRAGTFGIVWLTAWDSENDAEEARAAAERVMLLVPENERSESGTPTYIVERKHKAVLIVRNIEGGLAGPINRAFEAFATAVSS